MPGSLQEQLLKAGLVDADRLKSEKKARHRKKKKRDGKAAAPVDEAARQAAAAKREKSERDRRLNSERAQQARLREVRAQIRDIVEQHRVDRADGDTPYQFADRGKIKKIYVPAEMPALLAAGKLAIVRLEGRYDVVPGSIGARIAERDERVVIVHNDGGAGEAADPDYADHPIPDDISW